MVQCSVVNCSGGSDRSFSLFRIPKKSGSREKWLDFLVQSGRTIRYDAEYKVCEQHFLPSVIIMCKTMKKLRPGSFPTVLPEKENEHFEAELLIDDESQKTETCEEILLRQIQLLQDDLRKEKETSRKLRSRLLKARTRMNKLKRFLGKDQLSAASGIKTKWSNSSMKKAIMIRSKGGHGLLDYVCKNVVPLPSSSIIKQLLLRFELTFKKLTDETLPTTYPSKENFLKIVKENYVSHHCDDTLSSLAESFYRHRLTALKGRFLHSSNKFASTSLGK